MVDNQRLTIALEEHMRTYQALNELAKANSESDVNTLPPNWIELRDAANLAEIEYELALLESGWPPPFPPKTPEGLLKWNLTKEDVTRILGK